MAEHLFIVARHQPQLLRYLQQEFAAEPDVTVVVDRRQAQRRRGADAPPMDRRQGDRRARADIPQRLASLGYAFVRLSLVIATCLLAPAPAAAQLGVTNPTSPVIIAPKGQPPRESIPFGTEPNRFNNPYPTLPNAATNYASQYGTPLRQVWVEPQVVPLLVYVPVPSGVPEQWQTQYAEIPGYYVTETTTGVYYPGRWTIDQLNVGVYQWRLLPAEFRTR